MTKLLPTTTTGIQEVTLTDLLQLKRVKFHLVPDRCIRVGSFKGIIESAVRDIDVDNLWGFIFSSPQQWPSIKVTESDEGLVLIAGYHRYNARLLQIAIHNVLKMEGEKDREVLENALATMSSKQWEEVMHYAETTTIRAQLQYYEHPLDLSLDGALDNMRNGLVPSRDIRSKIAYEVYIAFSKTNMPFMQKEVAAMCNITPSALNQYIKKMERQEKQSTREVQSEGATPKEKETVETDVEEAVKKLHKAVTSLVGHTTKEGEEKPGLLESLYEITPSDVYVNELLRLFPFVVFGLTDEIEKDDTLASILAKMLDGYAEDTDKAYIRLVKVLTRVLKKREEAQKKLQGTA